MTGGAKKSDIHFIIDCPDRRGGYLFDALRQDGHRVSIYGDETDSGFAGEPVFLFAPSAEITREIALKILPGSRVFCFQYGAEVLEIFRKNDIHVRRYFDDELLAMQNAYLTAEGALAVIIEGTDRSLKDVRALILGGGRVGKSVAKVLHDNRCRRVIIATIDPAEYALASIFADGVYRFGEYPAHLSEFDLIVNTVPEQILKGEKLGKVQKNCFILDLASKPGGIDYAAAEALGLKTAHALGIPGKTAPYSAGHMIKESVLRILAEEFSISSE